MIQHFDETRRGIELQPLTSCQGTCGRWHVNAQKRQKSVQISHGRAPIALNMVDFFSCVLFGIETPRTAAVPVEPYMFWKEFMTLMNTRIHRSQRLKRLK